MKLFKKSFICFLTLILCISLFAACNDGEDEKESETVYYTVKFTEVEGGALLAERQVKHGSPVSAPPVPDKAGYVFDGWYKGNTPWYFEEPVLSDMVLSARWISAENVFEHTPTGDGKTTVITKLKKVYSTLRIPTAIGGYTVTGIGDGVFSQDTDPQITEIYLPESVTKIGSEAFKGRKDAIITVEGELEEVGEFAFQDCNGLKSVKFKDGITKISAYAFSGTGLSQISLPRTVTVIDENAFEKCASLVAAAMPSANAKVYNSAFFGTDIKVLYLYGNDEQVSEFLETGISSRNDPLLSAKIFLYSEDRPTEETTYDGFWYLDENKTIRIWK